MSYIISKYSGSINFSFNDTEMCFSVGDSIVTQRGTVSEKFKPTVKALKNGQKIFGYVKFSQNIPDLFPKEFKKAIALLTYLGVSTTLIDEEPSKKTKGKFVIVDLSPEQEAELNRLKASCE